MTEFDLINFLEWLDSDTGRDWAAVAFQPGPFWHGVPTPSSPGIMKWELRHPPTHEEIARRYLEESK